MQSSSSIVALLMLAGTVWASGQVVPPGYTAAGSQTAHIVREGKLYVIDPYLLPSASSGVVGVSEVLSSYSESAYYPAGMIADGTSTAIAVFTTPSRQNVTFAVNNGATLTDWNSAFLTTKPGVGGASLTVSAESLFPCGGLFCALALVQAPTDLEDVSDSSGILITADGGSELDGNSPSLTIELDYPAIILVHGLWGNLQSLSGIQAFLTSTGNYPPNWVVPVCYSRLLPWYASTDTLDNATNSDVCEQTSMDAIDFALQGIYSLYDNSKIIGGRVDMVVHSMGGLAARNYGGSPEYLKDIRSRHQGAIRTLVTIDTPAQGSLLANLFLEKAHDHYQASASIKAHVIWHVAGCHEDWDLETCFIALKMPIAAPGASPNSGAVFSLQPAVVNRNPSPTKPPNSTWAAVVGSFSDTGNELSVLRLVLNSLMSNLYPSGSSVPTTSQELGNAANDVIVTTASQEAGITQSADKVYFPGGNLEHSDTPRAGPFAFALDVKALSDANVLASSTVDNIVLTALHTSNQ